MATNRQKNVYLRYFCSVALVQVNVTVLFFLNNMIITLIN